MYMLDTNTVSDLFRRQPNVMARLARVPPSNVCISSITEAELLYGVAKRQSRALEASVKEFLDAVRVYDWDSEAAACYGKLRAAMEQKGNLMGAMDQLIAAHALSCAVIVVTSDHAFARVPGLVVENWR